MGVAARSTEAAGGRVVACAGSGAGFFKALCAQQAQAGARSRCGRTGPFYKPVRRDTRVPLFLNVRLLGFFLLYVGEVASSNMRKANM